MNIVLQDTIPSSPDRDDKDAEIDEISDWQPQKYVRTSTGREGTDNIEESHSEIESDEKEIETKLERKIFTQKRRKTKSPVKSASNGFNLFQLENRESLLKATPESQRKGKGWFNKVASKAWSQLDESTRKEYRERCTGLTGYQFFYSEQTKKFKEQNVKMKNGNMSGKVSDLWNSLSDEQRNEYKERASEVNQLKNKKKPVQNQESKLSMNEEQDEKEKRLLYTNYLCSAIMLKYITTKQYRLIRPFLMARNNETEFKVLIKMLRACLNDPNGKKHWEDNNGQEYLESVAKILTLVQ
jgi:hypothetical protein